MSERSALARTEAQRWRPDRLRPLYAEFFRNVRCQPGAPVIGLRDSAAVGTEPSRVPSTSRRYPPNGAVMPISFVVGVSDDAILKNNFMASPCVAGHGSPHQVILVRDGLNVIAEAESRPCTRRTRVGCLRARRCVATRRVGMSGSPDKSEEAERRFGPIGVAGVYGVGDVIASDDPTQPLSAERIGWVVDRGRMLKDGPELPARVATLDELLLVVRRDTRLQFDPTLGISFLWRGSLSPGTRLGMATVALGALCHHNSRHVGLRRGFTKARRSLPASGSFGCRSPRRVSSSTGTVRSSSWVTPHPGLGRSLTPYRVGELR